VRDAARRIARVFVPKREASLRMAVRGVGHLDAERGDEGDVVED
jgi:hypothetical protein